MLKLVKFEPFLSKFRKFSPIFSILSHFFKYAFFYVKGTVFKLVKFEHFLSKYLLIFTYFDILVLLYMPLVTWHLTCDIKLIFLFNFYEFFIVLTPMCDVVFDLWHKIDFFIQFLWPKLSIFLQFRCYSPPSYCFWPGKLILE